jgi:CubicO group peptidase (beta-lactamase class C family)
VGALLPNDPATGLGELYRGYGYHWWTGEEQTSTGPRSFYFASGNGGQRLFVVPSARLVVVVTSAAYGRGYAHRRAHAILRGVLDALQ